MLSVLLGVVVFVYLAVCGGLFVLQRHLQYFPQPRRLGPTQFASAFQRGDALLQLTVRTHPGPGAVLYFGGNGEDVSGSLGPLMAAFPGREIVMLHYRGFGGSTGRPTEARIADDAAALFDRVHATHPDVIVMGRSLGTGVAVRLASTRPVSRLVLVTPYDSLVGIAAGQFRTVPVRWLLIDKYESFRYAPRVTAPVLMLVAGLDETIPTASSAQLRERFAPGQVTWALLPRASHNTISDEPEFVRALAAFDVAPPAGERPEATPAR